MRLMTPRPAPRPARCLGHERLARERCEAVFSDGFQHDRIAADESEGGVPRPDRYRKVERADDPDGSQGVPLLHHPVTRSLDWRW